MQSESHYQKTTDDAPENKFLQYYYGHRTNDIIDFVMKFEIIQTSMMILKKANFAHLCL